MLPPVGDPVTQSFRPNHFAQMAAPSRFQPECHSAQMLLIHPTPTAPLGAWHVSFMVPLPSSSRRPTFLRCPRDQVHAPQPVRHGHEAPLSFLSSPAVQAPAPQARSTPVLARSSQPSPVHSDSRAAGTPPPARRPPQEARQQHVARRTGWSPRPCTPARAAGAPIP